MDAETRSYRCSEAVDGLMVSFGGSREAFLSARARNPVCCVLGIRHSRTVSGDGRQGRNGCDGSGM